MDCGFNVLLKYVPTFSLPAASSDPSTFSEDAVNAGLWSSQVEKVDFYELVICQVCFPVLNSRYRLSPTCQLRVNFFFPFSKSVQ